MRAGGAADEVELPRGMGTTTMGCHHTCRGSGNNARPSWLQATLSELENRFQSLSLHNGDTPDNLSDDSFADRAENYYQKRPQLLSLLHDLYSRYLSLADRYAQNLLKPQRHSRSQSQVSLVPSDLDDTDTIITDLTDTSSTSDADSSLSFQTPLPISKPSRRSHSAAEAAVAELIAKSVENELLRHELDVLERHSGESTRKMGLQKSLLEVLESERMVLLSENARLGFQANSIAEENEGLVTEVAFMRQRAEELARCVVKLREDHRVCVLGRRIEALQAQIYGLEKRNRECLELMARREEEKEELVRGVCVELEKVKAENKRLREAAAAIAAAKKGRRGWRAVVGAVEGCFACGSGGKGKGSHVGKRRETVKDDTLVTGCGGMTL